MDFEDLQESDVIFSSDYHNQSGRWKTWSKARNDDRKREKQQKMIMISSSPLSIPVNIPAVTGCFRYDIDVAGPWPSDQSSDDDDDDNDMIERLPPHLIVEMRVSGEIARSFSPLKGRNLCLVRNSVLRMTGFLER